MRRRLTLRREALASLTTDELGSVVGANLTPWVETFPPTDCLLATRTGYSLLECIQVTRDNCQTDLC